MVSNCLKECLLNLGVVSPTEVGQGTRVTFMSCYVGLIASQISSLILANLMEVALYLTWM